MIVSRLGHAGGAVHSAPRSKAPPNARPVAPAELFDANGDGVIENWSVLHGGDSFTTLDPAPTGSEPAPAHHATAPPPGITTHHLPATQHATANGTPAAIHHAQDAYQRDGLADSRATSAPPPAPGAPTPAPVPPPAPMPQGDAVAHLPSTG